MKTIKTALLFIATLWISVASAAQPTLVGEGKNVQIKEYRVDVDPLAGVIQVVGVARNIGNFALSNVFIEFNLYDESGTLIGNTIAHGMNLTAGRWWKFSAPITTKFNYAEIAKITAYQ